MVALRAHRNNCGKSPLLPRQQTAHEFRLSRCRVCSCDYCFLFPTFFFLPLPPPPTSLSLAHSRRHLIRDLGIILMSSAHIRCVLRRGTIKIQITGENCLLMRY